MAAVAALLVAAVVTLAVVGPGAATTRGNRAPTTATASGPVPDVTSTTPAPVATTVATVTVPDVVASARVAGLAAAQTQVATLGLLLRTTDVRDSSTCTSGQRDRHHDNAPSVVAQTPTAGTGVQQGSVVELFVCTSGTRD